MTLEIQVLALDRHKNVAVLSRLMGSQPSSLDNWISNCNIYFHKQVLFQLQILGSIIRQQVKT